MDLLQLLSYSWDIADSTFLPACTFALPGQENGGEAQYAFSTYYHNASYAGPCGIHKE